MKLTINFSDFKPWSNAIDTWNRIEEEGKIDELEAVLEEIYSEGMSDVELNDLLWFEPETVFGWLGIPDDEEDEDEEDGDFDTFCTHFRKCENCPLNTCKSIDDCFCYFGNHKDMLLKSISNSNSDEYDKSIINEVTKNIN